MSIVVDASIAIAWSVPDEVEPFADRILERVATEGAVVPALWHLEVANILVMKERRGKLVAAQRLKILAHLAALSIRPDAETLAHAFGTSIELAIRHRLSVYDAAYLELAMRKRLRLATLDGDLKAAARAEGVLLEA